MSDPTWPTRTDGTSLATLWRPAGDGRGWLPTLACSGEYRQRSNCNSQRRPGEELRIARLRSCRLIAASGGWRCQCGSADVGAADKVLVPGPDRALFRWSPNIERCVDCSGGDAFRVRGGLRIELPAPRLPARLSVPVLSAKFRQGVTGLAGARLMRLRSIRCRPDRVHRRV